MRYFICMLAFMASLSLSAQADKVYLKNGSLVKGELLKIENGLLSIDIGEAEPLSLSLDQLRFVRVKKKKTQLSAEALSRVDSLNQALRVHQLIHLFRIGVIQGGESDNFENGAANLSVDYTLFYALSANWEVGVGAGYDLYSNFQTVPIALEVRKNWGLSPSPFFTYFRAGMSRAAYRGGFDGFNASVKGQALLAYGIGKEWNLGSSAIQLSLGFRTQSLQSSWGSGDFRSTTDWNMNRLDIKVGLSF